MRAGIGFDAHGFDPDRPLVLGGVIFEGASGLAGWSDGDALCHAAIDALLGACSLGDLGDHFPAEKVSPGASSLSMLSSASGLAKNAGYRLQNLDCVVIAQLTRIKPKAAQMGAGLAKALEVPPQAVSIKATTTDLLGFTGRGEGIAVMAVALVDEI